MDRVLVALHAVGRPDVQGEKGKIGGKQQGRQGTVPEQNKRQGRVPSTKDRQETVAEQKNLQVTVGKQQTPLDSFLHRIAVKEQFPRQISAKKQ